MRTSLVAAALLVGCASEQTIRTQCQLPGPCFCEADCVEPDSDQPFIQCPTPRAFEVSSTYTVDIGGTDCDAIMELWGAGGGGGVAAGGGGAYARVDVSDYDTLNIQVGFPGAGGGAPDGAGGGGSASWVAERGALTLAVAGGGGGGGAGNTPRQIEAGNPVPAQTGTDGAAGDSGSGSVGGEGGFAAVGFGGRGGDSNGGGGGGGGSAPGIGGGPLQPGSTGGSWSVDDDTRRPSGVEPGNVDSADGAARGGAPNTDGGPGRIVIRFQPPRRR